MSVTEFASLLAGLGTFLGGLGALIKALRKEKSDNPPQD